MRCSGVEARGCGSPASPQRDLMSAPVLHMVAKSTAQICSKAPSISFDVAQSAFRPTHEKALHNVLRFRDVTSEVRSDERNHGRSVLVCECTEGIAKLLLIMLQCAKHQRPLRGRKAVGCTANT